MHVYLFNRGSSGVRNIAWLMGGIVVLAFTAGIMVDIDHPITWILGTDNGRFLHPFFALAGNWAVGIGIVLAISCICRFAFIRFLKSKNR